MSKKPHVQKSQPKISLQLLALAELMDGRGKHPQACIDAAADGLKDADEAIARRLATDADTNHTLDVIYEQFSKRVLRLEAECPGDVGGLTFDVIERSIWLGVGLAYRFFGHGGAR